MNFSSLEELKQRLMPALRYKKDELEKININVSEDKIWDFLTETKWKNAKDLSLNEMVNDILKTDFIE